jgi:aspartate/methionine/tyrosine aminotransferase
VRYDPEREITICCGSTEAMMAAMMAIINPGDETVVFEPSMRITVLTRFFPGARRVSSA